MLKVVRSGPNWSVIRASRFVVQRSTVDRAKAYSRHCHMRLDGSENFLVGGATAIHKGSGLWKIAGNKPDGSDVAQAIEQMKVPWQAQDEVRAPLR